MKEGMENVKLDSEAFNLILFMTEVGHPDLHSPFQIIWDPENAHIIMIVMLANSVFIFLHARVLFLQINTQLSLSSENVNNLVVGQDEWP